MYYSVMLPDESLATNYMNFLSVIPSLAEEHILIGPLAEFKQLSINQYENVKKLLPNSSDYTLNAEFDEFAFILGNKDILQSHERFDSVKVFFSDSGSVNTNFANPYLNFPKITFNYYSNINDNNGRCPIEYENLMSPEDMKKVTYSILHSLVLKMNESANEVKIKSLVNFLITNDFIKMKDEDLGLYFECQFRDSKGNINRAFSIGFPGYDPKYLFDLFCTIIEDKLKVKKCKVILHGKQERMNVLTSRVPFSQGSISFSSIDPFSDTRSNIDFWIKTKRSNYMEYCTKTLRENIVSDEDITPLLNIVDSLKLKNFSLWWDTLGSWRIDNNKNDEKIARAFFENYLELNINEQGQVHLNLIIDDKYSVKDTKRKIEALLMNFIQYRRLR